MTATHVKHLTEELQRYSPDAWLEFAVEVDGISPATQCTIKHDDSELSATITKQAEEIEDLEKENAKLRGALEEIELICDNDDIGDAERLKLINQQLSEVKHIYGA